jgi:Protein of unknown function (DUF3016)
MYHKLLLIYFCVLAGSGAVWAGEAATPAAQVVVTFVAPEKFTDVKDDMRGSEQDRDRLLGALKVRIESLARRYLAAGQTLEIQVTDVDMAGEFEPWLGSDFEHIRILKEVYPPRMKLEFRLLDAEGRVVSAGKRHLQDFGYLTSSSIPTTDPLRHDTDLVRDWLRQEFKPAS